MSSITPNSGLKAEPTHKIVLVGDSGVGKSSIFHRIIHNEFPTDKPTIGVQVARRDFQINNGTTVKVRTCDTAGLERYRAPAPGAYSGVTGAVVVFDLSNERSFERAGLWLQELRDHVSLDMPVLLVGNKSDLLPLVRKVGAERSVAFANDNGMSFAEVSALSGWDVDVALATLLTMVCGRAGV